MQLNGNNLVERFNRPSTNSRLGLRMSFINNGQYILPYAVKSCTIFPKVANLTPYTVLNDQGVLREDIGPEVLMNFSGTAAGSTYDPAVDASSIYIDGTDFVAVLDGQVALSGVFDGVVIPNQCSGVNDYIDVWTVQMYENSEDQVFINEFKLYTDSLVGLTQPLLLSTKNRLINKHVSLNSEIDLKVATEFVVENRELTQDMKNVLQEHSIENAIVTIKKIPEGDHAVLGPQVVVDRVPASRITADNTIIYNLTASNNNLDNPSGVLGTYALIVEYTLLNQLIVTKPLYFIVG